MTSKPNRPLLIPAACFLLGAALGPGAPLASHSITGPLFGLLIVGALVRGGWSRLAAGGSAAFLLGALAVQLDARLPADSIEAHPGRLDERPVLLRGRVHGLARRTRGAGGSGVVVNLALESVRVGRITLPMTGDLRFLADDDAEALLERAGRIEAWAQLRRPRPLRNFRVHPWPDGPWLARATAVELIEVLDTERSLIDRLRSRVSRAIDASAGPGRRGLARALVLGVRDELDPELQRRLRAGGTAHVLAVSGLHVALVSWAAAAVARRFGAGRHREALVVLCVAWSFAALAGFGLPVLRAAVLASCFSAGRLLGRGLDSWNALAAALLLTGLLRPDSVFGAGWSLTFGATAALLLLTRPLASLTPAPRRVWTARLRDGWAAGCSAWLGLVPVQLHWFGTINGAAPLLNLLAVPIAALATALSLAAATLACLSPGAARPLFFVVEGCASALGLLDGRLAVLPGAASLLAGGAWALGLIAWALLRDPRLRLSAALVLTLSGWSHLDPALEPWPPGCTARVTVLDVGQGSSTLIELRRPGMRDWCALIDGGGRPGSPRDVGEETVVPALRALGVRRLDLVLLSHADYDHRGGLPAVVTAFVPEAVLAAPVPAEQRPRLAALRRAAERFGRPLGAVAAGARFGPDRRLRVIWPPRERALRSRLVGNDASLVLRLTEGERGLALIPGDIEEGGESGLLGRGVALGAPLLVAPHHGSRTSSSPGFLAATSFRLAVVSAGHDNRFGHPHPEVVARLGRPALSAELGAIRARFCGGLMELDSAAGDWGGVLALVGPPVACKDPPP